MKKKTNKMALAVLALIAMMSFTACSQTIPNSNSTAGIETVQPTETASQQATPPASPDTNTPPPDLEPATTELALQEELNPDETEDTSEQEIEPSAVDVIDLYNEFKADSQAATSKYTGKSIVSTGIVVRTGSDIHGTPSIELSDTEGGKVYVLYVVNSFDQLDEVSVGERVTMKGNFHIFSTGEWGVVIKQGEIL